MAAGIISCPCYYRLLASFVETARDNENGRWAGIGGRWSVAVDVFFHLLVYLRQTYGRYMDFVESYGAQSRVLHLPVWKEVAGLIQLYNSYLKHRLFRI
jgi:hypothetical protein